MLLLWQHSFRTEQEITLHITEWLYNQRWAKSHNLVILKIKIEILTNYEFLKSQFSPNQVFLKIISKITSELRVSSIIYRCFMSNMNA